MQQHMKNNVRSKGMCTICTTPSPNCAMGKICFFCTKMMVTRNKTTKKHGTMPGRQYAMLLGENENAKI